MSKNQVFQYYVEGEDEEKLVSTLKSEMRVIYPGKIQVFNLIQKEITDNRLRLLKPNTIVVLIFDTDVQKIDILNANISKISSNQNVKDVICIPQIENMEDELCRSCQIKNIMELLGSTSYSQFKRDFIKEKNLPSKLRQKSLDIDRLWVGKPTGLFTKISNDGNRIKK